MSRNITMIGEQILKERSVIHDNIDPKLIFPDIKAAQDLYIEPILGTALFNKILDFIEAGTLSANTAYKALLDDYIVDTLLYFTLAELPGTISFQFWNKGILRKTADNTESPSMSDLVEISDRFKNRAESYAQRLTNYLRQNATVNLLPEYLSPGNGIDVVRPDYGDYTTPIYLGGDDGCAGTAFKRDYGFSDREHY